MNYMKTSGIALLLLTICLINQPTVSAQNTNHPTFEIASSDYADLMDKAIRHVEKFDWENWFDMMADDVEYYLPDGDAGTRTALIGKTAVMDFWNAYEKNSGNDKMIVTDIVQLPVSTKNELAYSKLTGPLVISYFSVEMHYGNEVANIRMNWGTHFNDEKKIDKIFTYYDRTPIIEAAKRNFLAQSNK